MADSSPTRRALPSPEEEAFLALVRTSELLARALAEVLKPEDISSTQYNVLRILRGARQGLTCGETAERMITRDPDVTRLLDRLEKRGLITRQRDIQDRRVVLTRITPEGLAMLARLDAPIRSAHHRLLGHLGRKRLAELTGLLEVCRGEAP